MFQAIQTRYYGATNYRPSRVKVWAQAGRKWHSYDHGMNYSEQAERFATEFAESYGWLDGGRTLAGGALPNGDYAFVLLEPTD
jgi:hypothetical protein